MSTIKICIASDHAGYELKNYLTDILKRKNIEVYDFGTHSAESMDYPDVIHPLAKDVQQKKFEKGIVICGSGNGASMVANKYPGIRCALCWEEEIAEMARLHNDANILALPARYISKEKAKAIVDVYLSTDFKGGRHGNRVNKINR